MVVGLPARGADTGKRRASLRIPSTLLAALCLVLAAPGPAPGQGGQPLPVLDAARANEAVPRPDGPVYEQPITDSAEPLPYGPGPSRSSASAAKASPSSALSAGAAVLSGAAPRAFGPQALSPATGPVATPDFYAVPNDQTLSVAAPGFLGNDIDLDGEALTATTLVENVANGTLAAFPNGSFTYTPDPGFTGTDSFVYRMRDASLNVAEATVTIEVLPAANRAPVGVEDRYAARANVALSIAAPGFLGNDLDPDGEMLTATALVENVANGTLTAFPNGSFTYTPDPGFTGTDSFVYRMQDASLNVAEATVTLAVVEGNRTPIGVADRYAARANVALSIAAPGFLGNDLDPDDDVLTATTLVENVANGTLTAFPNGSFTYTPAPGFTGTDSFVYRMRDTSFNVAEATVTIEVFAPGTTPVGTPDLYAVPNDRTLSIAAPGFLGNDIDLDGEALTATTLVENVANGMLAAFANGSYTYTPAPGFTGIDSFVYRMRDASLNVAEATVTIEVLPAANRAPIGVEDRYAAPANATLSIAAPGFLGNDIDPDGEALTATVLVENVANGTLTAFPNGHFTYTPAPGFTGTDSFVYRMRDASFNVAEATVTLEVVEGNRPPIGVEDHYAALTVTTLSIPAPGFLGNDIDLDGDALTATVIVQNVASGALAAFSDGSFTYTPDPGFAGTDFFTYRMRDAFFNASDPVTVNLMVIDPNPSPPPVADAGDDLTVECAGPDGATVTLDGSGSSDPDDTMLTYTWREGGTIVAGPTLDPMVDVTFALGTHVVTLSVEDPNGGVAMDVVVVSVVDTTSPTIGLASLDPLRLWPPNHGYRSFAIGDLVAGTADACDPTVSAATTIVASATSDEPEDAPGNGDGRTLQDIVLDPATCRRVELRAERQGSGNGRVYTIHLAAPDASGNVGTETVEVHVPRDRKASVVDDGPQYTVVCMPGLP